jgi:hypothetical protein
MHLAAEEGCAPVVTILANAGNSPLFFLPCAVTQRLSLSLSGADVNACALEGLTPLHEAARYGYFAPADGDGDDAKTPMHICFRLLFAAILRHFDDGGRFLFLNAELTRHAPGTWPCAKFLCSTVPS